MDLRYSTICNPIKPVLKSTVVKRGFLLFLRWRFAITGSNRWADILESSQLSQFIKVACKTKVA